MFGMPDLGLPFRSRDNSPRPPHFHPAARERMPIDYNDMDDFVTSPLAARDIWERHIFGSKNSGHDRFRDPDNLSRSDPAHTANYDFPAYRAASPRDTYPSRQASFEEAAASMYSALEHASKECQVIEKTFLEQTAQLSASWLQPQYLESLWTLRLEWNGNSNSNNPEQARRLKSENEQALFPIWEHTAQRFAKALSVVKASAPPEHLAFLGRESRYGRTSQQQHGFGGRFGDDGRWDVLRTTMRKLQVSLEAVEEFMRAVRTRRDRMPFLAREIGAAMQLLDGVRDMWETRPQQKQKEVPVVKEEKRKEREREREYVYPPTPGSSRRDHVWDEEYGAI